MTDEYIPREPIDRTKMEVNSPRERNRVDRIKAILRIYMVKGTEDDLEHLALKIWREVKR